MSDLREELERPVLNPAFVVVKPDEHTLHVRAGPWSGPVVTVRETEGDESVEELFDMLDGEHDLAGILDRYDPDDQRAILGLFRTLREKNVIYDAAAVDGRRGWPQLTVTPKLRSESRDRLADADVVVVSVGDVGPAIAEDLLRAGVGSVSLLQPLAERRRDVDELESTGGVSRLADRDGFSHVERDLGDALADADAATLALDAAYPSVARAFNEVALATGTPWLLAQVRGFDGLVGPVVFPGETACFECLQRRIEANLSSPGEYEQYREALEPSFASVGLPSFSRAVAGYASVDLLYLLAYGQSFTVERTLAVNFLNLSVEVNEVLKLPRCPACGTEAGDDVKRFVGIEDLVEADRLTGGN
jgi:bacteriocin biosynthesis cyclodehydratase domain-containing protein